MLARLGALLEPPVRSLPSATLAAMRELHGARQALIKDRTATLNRQKGLGSAFLKRQALQRLEQIKAQLAAIEAELDMLCVADPALDHRRTILPSIPGIGEATAIALLVEMPELWQPRAGAGRKLGRARTDGPRLRSNQRQALHPRRTRRLAAGTLHARTRRDPLQSRTQFKIPGAHRGRKASEARHYRRHAQASPARQRSPQRQSGLEAKGRLIITDTLVQSDPVLRAQILSDSSSRIFLRLESGADLYS